MGLSRVRPLNRYTKLGAGTPAGRPDSASGLEKTGQLITDAAVIARKRQTCCACAPACARAPHCAAISRQPTIVRSSILRNRIALSSCFVAKRLGIRALHDHLRRGSRMRVASTAEGHLAVQTRGAGSAASGAAGAHPDQHAASVLAGGRHGGSAGCGLVRVPLGRPLHAAHSCARRADCCNVAHESSTQRPIAHPGRRHRRRVARSARAAALWRLSLRGPASTGHGGAHVGTFGHP